jgi:flagellar protein FlbT
VALKIALKAGETFVVNGAVLTNGDRRSVLLVQNRAAILRERDLMTEEQATTPARRLYYACMLRYIDPETASDHDRRVAESMEVFAAPVADPGLRLAGAQISLAMANGDYYRALAACRELIEQEDRLGLGTQPLSESA